MRRLFNLLGLCDSRRRSTAFRLGGALSHRAFSRAFSMEALPQQFGNWLVNRAGVRLLFRDADLRQHFNDHV
jgi:hypothetical protein